MAISTSELALDLSQWVIESASQTFLPEGHPSFRIGSVATQLEWQVSQSDAISLSRRNPLDTVTAASRDHVDRVERYVHERLGLRMRTAAVGVRPRGGGLGVTAVDAAQWLSLLGYEQPSNLAANLLETPVPLLGSPPQEWLKIGELVGANAPSPFVIAAGLAAWNERPILAILAGGTGVVVWFAKPFARTVRDHYVETLEERLQRDDDLRS